MARPALHREKPATAGERPTAGKIVDLMEVLKESLRQRQGAAS